MVLGRSPKKRIRGKAPCSTIHWVHKTKDEIPVRTCQRLLPRLYNFTRGTTFSTQAFRDWLLTQRASSVPTDANALLAKLSENRRLGNQLKPAPAAWVPTGIRFEDDQAEAHIQNVCGFEWTAGEHLPGSKHMSWNEYGWVYRLKAQDSARGLYQVVRSKAFKRASALVAKRTVTMDKKTSFKSCCVMDLPPGRCISEGPKWSLIYLHSFSQKGTEYLDFPHYFNVCGAGLRVVMPTAPLLEQQCFKDWYVWRGGHLGWRRIKFNAWFDYVTDKGGVAENQICEDSLRAIREKLHKLIRHEVHRVGDPRRVIVGGQSQGCCAALDATLTFEQELGGFVGLVGHLLRSTPLDSSKRNMPLHLFHEENDKEMRWKWVQSTVQRLIDAGFNVSSKREKDPAGCGHWIQDIEGRWVRSALRQIIFERDTQ